MTEQIVQSFPEAVLHTWNEKNFTQLSEIQQKAIPLIREGKDVVMESPTGTGKTLAYLLPIIEKINTDSKYIGAVILAPSRELVMQIFQEVQVWAKGTDIRCASMIGGANTKKQIEKLKTNPHIIVGTPGRILELNKQRKLKMHEVKTIVIDEGDVLVEAEHVNDVKTLIKATQRDRQIVLCTATLSPHAISFGMTEMNEAVTVQVEGGATFNEKVRHLYVISERREKIDTLRSLVRSHEARALVFINDIEKMEEIQSKLSYRGLKVASLEGSGTKQQRQAALSAFRAGKMDLLLATDVAARGLDIENLEYVIHFDVPFDAKQYVHRSGRTGRMGKAGTVISIVTKQEESFLEKAAAETGVKLEKQTLFKGEMIAARERHHARKEEQRNNPTPKKKSFKVKTNKSKAKGKPKKKSNTNKGERH